MSESLETEIKNYIDLVNAKKLAVEQLHQANDAMVIAERQLSNRLTEKQQYEVAVFICDHLHVLVLDADDDSLNLHMYDYVPVVNEGITTEAQP